MKRTALSLLGCLVVASGLVIAQSTPPQQTPPTQPQKDSQDVTLTGCLTQGSAPAVFILDNARLNVDDKTEKAKSFVLVAGTEDLNLAKQLNHEVTVTGQADQKTMVTPPAGQKVQEKDLPRLTAKSLISIADKCTAAR